MSFKKYQSAEKVEAVSPRETSAIREVVRKTGKVSASELTEAERAALPQEKTS